MSIYDEWRREEAGFPELKVYPDDLHEPVPHARGCCGPLPSAPEETVTIVFEGDEVRFVHNDDVSEALKPLGPNREIRRASNVEPVQGSENFASFDMAWAADMKAVGGPTIVGSKRKEVIAAEVRWLEENGVPFPADK